MSNVVSLQLPAGIRQPSHAAVVIIGGGIMGTSIAFHLAEAGVRNIVLVDRSDLGAGSSAKPLGGVRATFSDPANIVLGQRSLRAFEGFGQQFSTDIGLRKVGYLFLCRSESELLDCERSTVIQNGLGSNSRMISPAEAVGNQSLPAPGSPHRRVVLTGGWICRTGESGPSLCRRGRRVRRVHS